jgi:hypothetical protein
VIARAYKHASQLVGLPHTIQMEPLKEKIAVAEHGDGSVKYSKNPSSLPLYTQGLDVVFEEYLYYAALQRRAEDQACHSPSTELLPEKRSWFNQLSDHKGPNVNINISHMKDGIVPTSEDEAERMNALRALKVTSWMAVFYLITTDIIGPFNAPYAISQVGWVPGKHSVITTVFVVHFFCRNLVVCLQFVLDSPIAALNLADHISSLSSGLDRFVHRTHYLATLYPAGLH